MASNRKYKCPFCKLHDTKEKLIHHIDKKHSDMLPEGFSSGRVLFHFIHNKPYSEKGKCVICKGDTDWNEKTYKYNRLCNNRACKDKLREEYKKNMLRVHGTYNILNDMDQQEKMLRNRSISGIYKFQNGKMKQYVGSYEKKFLEFCDVMLNMDPDDIMMPGPTIEYTYKGETHKWITDALIVPFNCVLDIKDGGSNSNKREMVSYREKQVEKEKVITDKGEYNYLRLTDNKFHQLIGILYELKLQFLEDPNSDKTISRIHESAQPLLISEKDVEYRVDDFKNHKVPVLWITGQSGGGKTTIANKMADAMNCDLLGIDDIEHFLHMLAEPDKADEIKRAITQDKNYKMIYDRLGKNKQLIEDMTIHRGWSNTEWTNHYKKLFLWLYKMVKMIVPRYTNSNQCIIEGVQIPQLYIEDKSLFKNCAIIVRGTSTVTSLIRRLKRDNPTFGSIKDIPGTLDNIFGYLKMYKDWHKDISEFRDKGPIKESSESHLDNIEVEVDNMTTNTSIQEAVKIPAVNPKDIQFIKALDGTNNAYITYKGDNYRVRVETLIINDKGQVYADKGNTEKYKAYGITYRLPGGSVEPKLEFIEQAANECKEEAFIKIKNAYYSGQSWVMMFPKNGKSGIPNFHYKGCVSYVYVAEYDGPYTGYVKKVDRDSMGKTGKFYDVKDVDWSPEHKKALDDYFKAHTIVKESSDNVNPEVKTAKQAEYKKYLDIHKVRLKMAFNDRIIPLKNALLLSDEQCQELKNRIIKHDASRLSPEEFEPLRKLYFPADQQEKEEGKNEEKDAWAHHYANNDHHPQHWKGKEIPDINIAEMIIDWEADCRKDGGNPLDWYLHDKDAEKTKKEINTNTRLTIEMVLRTIYEPGMNLKDNIEEGPEKNKED